MATGGGLSRVSTRPVFEVRSRVQICPSGTTRGSSEWSGHRLLRQHQGKIGYRISVWLNLATKSDHMKRFRISDLISISADLRVDAKEKTQSVNIFILRSI